MNNALGVSATPLSSSPMNPPVIPATHNSIALKTARGIVCLTACVALAAFAQWSPDAFLGLLGGSLTAGLAVIISGWN
jgi:hypothetical protein